MSLHGTLCPSTGPVYMRDFNYSYNCYRLSLIDLLEALTECCMNVYLKTIKVNPSVLKRLTPLKEDLRFVADNRNPLNQRREVLLQKGEGFLSLILTPIVEQLASLLTQ